MGAVTAKLAEHCRALEALPVFPGQAEGLNPESMNTALTVMVGLVPTIHVFTSLIEGGVQDVDARHKGEHDELEQCGVPE